MASRNTGSVRAPPIHNRRIMSRISLSSPVSSVTAFGSRAMPQMGQTPGPSSLDLGVHRAGVSFRGPGFHAGLRSSAIPHFGQSPGLSDSTPGHIGQKYFAAADGFTSAFAGVMTVLLGGATGLRFGFRALAAAAGVFRFRRFFVRGIHGCSGVGAAMAVQASVGGAQSARLFEPLAHLPPRPMQPHFEVVARDADFLRDDIRRPSVEIGALQHLGVLWAQRRQQSVQAFAGRLFQVCIRNAARINLLRELLQRFRLRGPPAVQIGQHVAEDAIKPREEVFIVGQRPLTFERPQQALLHGIRGELIVAESSSREALKRAEIGEQGRRER